MEKVIQELYQVIREMSKKSYDVPNYVVSFGGKKLGEWTLYSAQAEGDEVSVTFSHKGTQIKYSTYTKESYQETWSGVTYEFHPLKDRALEILNLIKNK